MDPYLVIPKQDCQGQHLILNSPLLISPFSPTPETWLHIAPCSWGAKLLILVEEFLLPQFLLALREDLLFGSKWASGGPSKTWGGPGVALLPHVERVLHS